MKSATFEFFRYLLGLRKAQTSDTDAELSCLSKLATLKNCIIEIGVFEGVASNLLCESMSDDGKIYLVDPYFQDLKLERVLGISFTEFIAKRNLKKWDDRAKFIKMTSVDAANALLLQGQADLIFVDARHDYEAVKEDFSVWQKMLAPYGVIAFHDSQCCLARPNLNVNDGPVRLCKEISQGQHGAWKIIETTDSITVVCKV